MKRFIAFLAVVALATFLSAQPAAAFPGERSEEHTSELQSQSNLVCRLLLEKKKKLLLTAIFFVTEGSGFACWFLYTARTTSPRRRPRGWDRYLTTVSLESYILRFTRCPRS